MLIKLMWLVVAFYIKWFLFIVVAPGITCLIFNISLLKSIKFIKKEIYITFETSSSESVLSRLPEKLPKPGILKQVTGIVLPIGYSFNLDGTSIYMSMGVIFLAGVYGFELSLEQLFGNHVTDIQRSGNGLWGAFVVFSATITITDLIPLEGVAVMFGVYRFMSMALAVTNVIGNTVASLVVAKVSCGLTAKFNYNDEAE